MCSPVSDLLISSCCLTLVLGMTVSLVWGQAPSHLLTRNGEVTGMTIPITDVGQGGGESSAMNCFPTNEDDDIVWWFPGRTTMVPMETTLSTNPTTITSFRQPTALSLLRSSTIRSPTGEYCCALQSDINQRICVTLQSDCTSVPLSNGMVDGTGTILEGQTADYTCNPGYIKPISAPDTITCGTDSQWTPLNICNRHLLTRNGVVTGMTIPITDVGQGGDDSPAMNCFPTNEDDDIVWWFPGRTTMVPMETSFPSNPTTITSFRQPTALSLLRSSTIRSPTGEYCCALQSDINQRICVTLQSDCTSVPISNGVVEGTGTILEGQTADYTCNPGYIKPISAPDTITCGTDSQWTPSNICNPVDCMALTNPVNGQVMTPSGTLFNSVATYSCFTGYNIVGSASRTCQLNGLWSSNPPTCQIVDCGLLTITNGQVALSSGTVYNSMATYICDSGYHLNGVMTRTCLSNGQWSSSPPTCDRICSEVLSLTDGVIAYNPNTTPRVEGTTATHVCNTGFELSGGPVRTCQASNGMWSGQVITCAAVDCGTLPSIMNGTVETSSGTVYNNMATYSCNNGYHLNGVMTRTCLSTGQWSSSPPTCEPITAEVVPPDDPPIFGQSYSLMCIVTGADSLNPTINYQWFKTTPNRTQVGTNSPTLTFVPLVLSDAGQYGCETTLVSVLSQDVTVVSSDHEVQFTSLNIQLRFNGILNCREYTLLDPDQKTLDITTGLAQGVESLCGCGFTTTFISSPSLQCFDDSPQHVTYRAVLTETNNATTVQLVSYIKQWTASTQSLVVQSVRLGINTTCPSVIIDFNSPECSQATSPPPTNPLPGDIGGIIGGVVAGVFVLVILAAVIVIVLLVVRYRKTGSKAVQNNTSMIQLNEVKPLSVAPQPYSLPIQQPAQYEELDQYQGNIAYDYIDPPNSNPPTRDYEFSQCPAYQTSVLGERGTSTADSQIPSVDGLYDN